MMPMYNPYPPYYPQYPQQSPLLQQPQIQNGGFISVPSEAVARSWAVAAGTSVTFKDENAPYCYTKTMGFSQLDQPKFEKYRLVKEEVEDAPVQEEAHSIKQEELDDVRAEIGELRERIEKIERKPKQKKMIVEEDEDDA